MNASQKRAVENHWRRLQESGFARYEVRGLASDKALVRRLAKRPAENDATAERLSAKLQPSVAVANWLGERDASDLFIATLTLEDRSDALAARST